MASRVTDRDSAVRAFVQDRRGELIDFARELIATPSPNPPGDERAVAEVAMQAMHELGYARVDAVARADTRPNVVGEIGTGSRSLLLNGHLDTQPPGDLDAWRTPPWDPQIDDGRLYGLGASDMKGAVAAMVYAGGAVAAAGDLDGTLRVVLTADEEAGSSFGARFLADEGLVRADAALVGEAPGDDPWEYLAVAARGTSRFHIRIRGTQMHSGLTDRLPSVNASVKMAQLLARMAAEFEPRFDPLPGLPGRPAVNLGVVVEGGISFSFCPPEASFGTDVRTLPGMTFEELRADLEGFLESARREDPELDAELEWLPEMAWFPPCSIESSHPLVTATRSSAEEVLQRQVPLGLMPAFTDGSRWAAAGIACIPAFGPGSLALAHRPNEYVAVPEVVDAATIYGLTAVRFLGAA
jgi:acetylornithine deacetylase